MSAERRLSKRHATVMLALHMQSQELQRKLQELDETINGMVTEWLPVYEMDPEQQHRVEVRPDGELYLVEIPKPAETKEDHHAQEGNTP